MHFLLYRMNEIPSKTNYEKQYKEKTNMVGHMTRFAFIVMKHIFHPLSFLG